MFAMLFARAFDSAVARAGADESTASTDSARRARWSAEKPPVEVKQSRNPTARGHVGNSHIIFPLIEINSRLLTLQQVGFEIEAVHLDRDPLRYIAKENGHLQRQTFELTNRGVVSSENARRSQQFLQAMNNQVTRPVHPLAERLNHQAGAISVDNDQSEGNRSASGNTRRQAFESLTTLSRVPDCGGEAAAEEFLIDRFRFGG